MKFTFYFIFLSSILSAQTSNRIEITPFIVTSVILKDSTLNYPDNAYFSLADASTTCEARAHFLSPENFYKFQSMMWEMVSSPGSYVYASLNANPLNSVELQRHILRCDTAIMVIYTNEGDELVQYAVACDSTIELSRINKLDFYESWFYNPANCMIERDVLGYCAWNTWDVPYRMFYVFRDKTAVQKAKDYLLR